MALHSAKERYGQGFFIEKTFIFSMLVDVVRSLMPLLARIGIIETSSLVLMDEIIIGRLGNEFRKWKKF